LKPIRQSGGRNIGIVTPGRKSGKVGFTTHGIIVMVNVVCRYGRSPEPPGA
jgi:hypothetical protein